MMNRKGAVSMAIVAAVTATAGSALAETNSTPTLTLEPTVATMQAAPAAAARKPLMTGLEQMGAASTLDQYNINIYGWVEGSYTYNHRHVNRGTSVGDPNVVIPPNKVGPIGAAPFNHEANDGVMGNQLAIRFERTIADTSKVDVGGLVEVMYGQDAAAIHSNGLEYGNTGGAEKGGFGDRFHPNYQFDIPQAYIDISVGIKGLTFRAGKFYTLLGYEVIKPDENPLFSHSYMFYAMPFTHVGILASYQINDQWSVTGGITRGWDQALEDTPDCAIDALFKVQYVYSPTLTFALAGSVGPENSQDTSHYRTVIDPTVIWKVTNELSLAAEVCYMYDGNYSGSVPRAYGDVWGAAVYAGYKINEYVTVNARAEKFHDFRGTYAGTALSSLGTSALNIYSFTLGVTVTPFPNDPFGQGLKIRPEVRYDYSEDRIFDYSIDRAGGFKDQFTMGVDVIYSF